MSAVAFQASHYFYSRVQPAFRIGIRIGWAGNERHVLDKFSVVTLRVETKV